MTPLQAIVSIFVALIAGTTGGGLVFAKFWIERKDKKEEKTTQSMIDESIKAARKEITQEIKDAVSQGIVDCGVIGDKAIREVQEEFVRKLDEGLKARSEEGAERFKAHARNFEETNKQIEENGKQISTLSSSVDKLVSKMDTFTNTVSVLAESSCNSNYDRLLMVTSKILKNGSMTIADKTNLRNLYKSWKELGGKDAEMDTTYEECMNLKTILE